MKHIIKNFVYILLWIALIACAVLWVISTYAAVESCWYKFPAVYSWFSLFLCICSVVFPVIVLVRIVSALLSSEYRKASIRIACFIPVYILSFFLGAAVSLGTPAIYSYSSNPDDYGVYDQRPGEILRLNPPEYYPNTVPENARDVRYIYQYQNTSAESLYIAISWQSTTQEIESLTEQLDDSKIVQIVANQVMVQSTDGYYNNAVFIDYNENRVCYVITSPWMPLPTSLREASAAWNRETD